MKKKYCFLSLIIMAIAIAFTVWNAIARELEGLVLFLPFEESGTPVDHSLNPSEISLKGGKLKQVNGKIGKSAEFDGSTYIEVKHSAKLEGMDALTIEVWIKPDKTTEAGIASKRVGHQSQDSYNFFFWGGSRLYARVNASGEISSQTAFKEGEWYHVAYVFDGNAKGDEKSKIYINGKLDAQAPHSEESVPEGGAPLWIGELGDGRGFVYSGVMDELGIWSRALSEEEIKLAMAGKEKWRLVEPRGKLTTTWGEMKI